MPTGSNTDDSLLVWDLPPYRDWVLSVLENTRRFAARRLKDPGAAEDVAQDTVIAAVLKGVSFYKTRGDFERHSFGIARRLVANRARRDAAHNRKHLSLDDIASLISNETISCYSYEQLMMVGDCIAALPALLKECVAMRFYDCMKNVDIAKRIGRHPGHVRRILHKAFPLLLECLLGKGVF